MPFVQESFGFDDICLGQDKLAVTMSYNSLVFALAGISSQQSPDSPLDGSDACELLDDSDVLPTCIDSIQRAKSVLLGLGQQIELAKLLSAVAMDAANITLMQFAGSAVNPDDNYLLQQQLVAVGGRQPWNVFGWIQLYDWARQTREVVRFDGGLSSVTLMSKAYAPVAFAPSSMEIPQKAGTYFRALILYISCMFATVALVVLAYGVSVRFHVLGRNLFRFNRIVGSVWVGRIFLFVRGMTAVIYLNTSNIEFATHRGLVYFAWFPYSLPKALLLSGEATWVSYVLQDVLVEFASDHTYVAAPVSTALSWLVLFAIEVTSPMAATATLKRSCTTMIMTRQVVCTSGTIRFGGFDRVVLTMAIQVGIVFAVYATAVARQWRRRTPTMPLYVSGASVAYLDYLQIDSDGDDNGAKFDVATHAMGGVLTFSFRGRKYLFDLKSWTVTQLHRADDNAVTAPDKDSHTLVKNASNATTKPFKMQHRVIALGGLVYMVSSLGGSVLYIFSTQVNMANDFWWATFNSTGTQAYLCNWYTRQVLLTPTNYSDTLDNTKYGDVVLYNTTSTVVSSSQVYAKLVQFHVANATRAAIQGMRAMDGCEFPRVMTQYCWLDFRMQYPMANTAARQRRCDAKYKTNGAVYLEAGLRNIDWPSFRTCWHDAFQVAVESELRRTQEGTTWLRDVQNVRTSVADEASYWASFGVVHYTTQYQNYKKLGVTETFTIENAFGVAFPMTIKSTKGKYQVQAQTSMKLYWSFANDLSSVMSAQSTIAGRSMVASSANFAFANVTMEAVLGSAREIDVPLSKYYASLRDVLGPFGSIDARHVACPLSLRRLYKNMSEAIAHVVSVNSTAQLDFAKLPQISSWMPCPNAWYGVYRQPGNLLCDPKSSTGTPASILSFWGDGGCSVLSESIGTSRMSNTITSLLSTATSIDEICYNELRSMDACVATVNQSWTFGATYFSSAYLDDVAAAARLVQKDVAALNVSLMQFDFDSGVPLVLDLFVSADFDFFSWGLAFEWLLTRREVVSFEGDVGTMVLMSATSAFIDGAPNPLEIPVNMALYARSCVLYITAMLALVATLATGYILFDQGYIEGLNMLEMNRVGGIVWIGRPLLFLRSMVAICLLSTSTLELKQFGPLGYMTSFEKQEFVWYKLILASGEIGWLVYVVGDIATIVTRAYTTTYAVASGLVAWIVAAILTVCFPLMHTVTVDRECTATQLDFQLVCNVGTVYIGSTTRFGQLVAVSLACTVLCYVVERLRQPSLVDKQSNASLLLSAGSKYLYALDPWTYKDCIFLDKASAVVTGILCIKYQTKFYVLDIKLWRTFVMDVPADLQVPPGHEFYERALYAFPLVPQ